MRLTVHAALFILAGTMACDPPPATEPASPVPPIETTSALMAKKSGPSLRQRLDAISQWPDLGMDDLEPLLTEKTTFQMVGSMRAQVMGKHAIIALLKRAQTDGKHWRLVTSRGVQTPARLVLEFEVVRCKTDQLAVCNQTKPGFLFATIDKGQINDITLYLNPVWQTQNHILTQRKSIRWVSGRRNPNLETIFRQIWEGDLQPLLGKVFHFVDTASGLELKTREAFINHRARHKRFVPEGQCKPTEIHSAGDIVIALSSCTGVYQRQVFGQGKTISVKVADIGRFDGSSLVELRSYSNHDEVKTQLGFDGPNGFR
jgi:hypothetical protein